MNRKFQKNWVQILVRASNQIDRQISNTGKHSTRVAFWARQTARQMQCNQRDTQLIHWAALLHDIGKLGVPAEILKKAGPLDENEWALIRMHPTIGSSLVTSTNGIARIAPIVLGHQEKFDGSGYPYGLSGSQIPMGARILAVADAYDAMTSDRVYRKAFSHTWALDELNGLAGKHFDPGVVEAFMGVVREQN